MVKLRPNIGRWRKSGYTDNVICPGSVAAIGGRLSRASRPLLARRMVPIATQGGGASFAPLPFSRDCENVERGRFDASARVRFMGRPRQAIVREYCRHCGELIVAPSHRKMVEKYDQHIKKSHDKPRHISHA